MLIYPSNIACISLLISEEDQRVQRTKYCDFNNQYEDISPNASEYNICLKQRFTKLFQFILGYLVYTFIPLGIRVYMNVQCVENAAPFTEKEINDK